MKKIILLFFITVALFALTACGGKEKAFSYAAPTDGVLGTDNMDAMLRKVLNISDEHPNGDMGERRPFSESEKRMAEHIESIAVEIADGDDSFGIDIIPYGVSGYGETRNVIIKKSGYGEEPRKLVVVCANYDGLILQSGSLMGNNNQTVSESIGALENGTGTAATLALMQYVKGKTYEFDIEFALFGDGSYGNTGASRYVSEMPSYRKENILTVYSLKRFGGDNLYMYNEEVATDYGDYLFSVANDNAFGIVPLPKHMPVINARAFPRLPYAHWAMAGVHSPFMNEHIPVAAVFSGNYETLNLSDIESASSQIVSYTREDTYTRLRRDFPMYDEQMSAAASFAAKSFESPDFVSAMTAAKSAYKNYDWATKKLIVQLAVIALLIAAGVAVILIAKKFEKKYPYVPPRLKLKIAVFGAEYEDKDADVIVDVKRPGDPFGGY